MIPDERALLKSIVMQTRNRQGECGPGASLPCRPEARPSLRASGINSIFAFLFLFSCDACCSPPGCQVAKPPTIGLSSAGQSIRIWEHLAVEG
jgi:hypothetical protein